MPPEPRCVRMDRDASLCEKCLGRSQHKAAVFRAICAFILEHCPAEAVELHRPIRGGYNAVYRLAYTARVGGGVRAGQGGSRGTKNRWSRNRPYAPRPPALDLHAPQLAGPSLGREPGRSATGMMETAMGWPPIRVKGRQVPAACLLPVAPDSEATSRTPSGCAPS